MSFQRDIGWTVPLSNQDLLPLDKADAVYRALPGFKGISLSVLHVLCIEDHSQLLPDPCPSQTSIFPHF